MPHLRTQAFSTTRPGDLNIHTDHETAHRHGLDRAVARGALQPVSSVIVRTKERSMFKGIDHVVIAVKDLDSSIGQFEKTFGVSVSERGEPQGAGFKNAHLRFDESYLELVSPTDDTGPVGRRVAASGDGVYLIALRVDDIEKTVQQLRDKGVRLVGDPGAGNPIKGQIFIHPSAAGGVLTQIVQR